MMVHDAPIVPRASAPAPRMGGRDRRTPSLVATAARGEASADSAYLAAWIAGEAAAHRDLLRTIRRAPRPAPANPRGRVVSSGLGMRVDG
jgi:hypothetical protein